MSSRIFIVILAGITPILLGQTLQLQQDQYELNGRTVEVQRGWLTVPESRTKSDGRQIELAVLLCPAREEGSLGAPITYLAGGPGGSAVSSARFVLPALWELNKKHPIVFMDQRGTGRSKPRLYYPREDMLPSDAFADKAVAQAYFLDGIRRAVAHFKAQGVDLHAYNSVESAHDLNDLRVALKADTLSLIGFSYGTHLGLAYLRYHPTRVGRFVAVGTEGPNHTVKLPATFDAQLAKLSVFVAEQPEIAEHVPDLMDLYRSVEQQLTEKPLTLTVTSRDGEQTKQIQFGAAGLALIFRIDLGDGNDIPYFPAMLYGIRHGHLDLITQYAAKRYFQFSRGVSLMSLMVDASSGVSASRLAEVGVQAKESVVDNVLNGWSPDVLAAIGHPDLGADYRGPLTSSVPTLFISGTLDANTPPYQAETLRWGFANAVHLIVENAGHEDMLPHPDVQKAIVDFLAGNDVSGRHIRLPKPQFKGIAKRP